jgi:hypothetical protein
MHKHAKGFVALVCFLSTYEMTAKQLHHAYNNSVSTDSRRAHYNTSVTRFVEAVKHLLCGRPIVAYANVGNCAKRTGEVNSAEQYLNKALKIQPCPYYLVQCLVNIQLGRFDALLTQKA